MTARATWAYEPDVFFCAARDSAFLACARSWIGYFRVAGYANALLRSLRRVLARSLAIVVSLRLGDGGVEQNAVGHEGHRQGRHVAVGGVVDDDAGGHQSGQGYAVDGDLQRGPVPDDRDKAVGVHAHSWPS